MSKFLRSAFLVIQLFVIAVAAYAQTTLSPELTARIDKAATDALIRTGTPSASLAVVKDGQIVYRKAYGMARLETKTPADPSMRYSIGSVSKQFTAAAILLLQEQGKLSLDDKVGKYLPSLTRANEVTIRQLLSHTSGYQDYWPQDYVMPMMLKPVTADKIMEMWAKKPLDFEPGTKWQYSNTNYVIAGAIVEKVSGMPLIKFLQEKVFAPLGMATVANIDERALGETDPTGYMRYGLGPLHPAPKEGAGWLFAAGELAMTAEDLAKWDISMMNGALLKPASYQALGTDTLLKSGLGTHYGLGVDVSNRAGKRALSHSGEVSGFTAQNIVFPDERAAIVVLTNQDAIGTSGEIAGAVASALFATSDPATPAKLAQARKIFEGLQKGTIDRTLFTDNANAYFNETALADFAASLGPLGAVTSFDQTGQGLRGGMVQRSYRVKVGERNLAVWTFEMPDGKLEQFMVSP
jgi:CubicO group peptidase (beta-lactamase class C family)